MIRFTIFVIDDEEELANGITASLQNKYRVTPFYTARSALDFIDEDPPDLILLDIGLPDMNGVEALGRIKKRHPEIPVIMITAFEDVHTVVSAMKSGAYDYIVKPIKMDVLELDIQNALETVRLRKEVQILQEKCLTENLPCFIGESQVITDVMNFVTVVAKSPDTPVLVCGQSGTGKELIASAIHYRSPNFRGPFVTVNCAAIPRDLVESELFGYEKGAFSGARDAGKQGLVEQARGGTLFLDEIGDLNLEAQAKLLRFLESGEFYRVGGLTIRNSKTRVVSATNKSLESLIENKEFREDLLFRIGVVQIDLPVLNQRREDIIPIARHFLFQFGEKLKKNFTHISSEAEAALTEHHWQGNVRELKNMIELASLISNGPELTLADLGLHKTRSSSLSGQACLDKNSFIPTHGVNIESLLQNMEKEYIKEALRISHGNETKASSLLGLKSTTFRYRRLKLLVSREASD